MWPVCTPQARASLRSEWSCPVCTRVPELSDLDLDGLPCLPSLKGEQNLELCMHGRAFILFYADGYFFYMVSVHHASASCLQRSDECAALPELELQAVLSHHVCAGN